MPCACLPRLAPARRRGAPGKADFCRAFESESSWGLPGESQKEKAEKEKAHSKSTPLSSYHFKHSPLSILSTLSSLHSPLYSRFELLFCSLLFSSSSSSSFLLFSLSPFLRLRLLPRCSPGRQDPGQGGARGAQRAATSENTKKQKPKRKEREKRRREESRRSTAQTLRELCLSLFELSFKKSSTQEELRVKRGSHSFVLRRPCVFGLSSGVRLPQSPARLWSLPGPRTRAATPRCGQTTESQNSRSPNSRK